MPTKTKTNRPQNNKNMRPYPKPLPRGYPNPYRKYMGTKTFAVLTRSLRELYGNLDLELIEVEEYVVGYMCKSLEEKGLLK
jgi:hypothetical protein